MIHLIPSHQGRPADDLIFALNREATERRKKGEKIINATVGALLNDDGSLAILPTAARAVREVPPEEWATYAPISGTPDFLRAVIDDLFAEQPELKSCAIASATPGGSGALRHAIANFLEPGQSLLTTSYFWGPYQTLSDESDRKVATFSMFDADGGLDVGALDRGLSEQLKVQGRSLIFLNDPCHNPTGYSMAPEEWKGVAECVRNHAQKGNVTLLIDCAYFQYNPRNARAFLEYVKPLAGALPILFAWSASKSFTHYGLRVGALVACIGDEKERRMTEAALSYSSRGTWSNCNRGGLSAITKLLTDRALASDCNRERDELKATLNRRVSAFNRAAKTRNLRYPRYEGGYFVTVFKNDAPQKAEQMRTKGVYVVPQSDALRVAICSVAEADIAALVDALAT